MHERRARRSPEAEADSGNHLARGSVRLQPDSLACTPRSVQTDDGTDDHGEAGVPDHDVHPCRETEERDHSDEVERAMTF